MDIQQNWNCGNSMHYRNDTTNLVEGTLIQQSISYVCLPMASGGIRLHYTHSTSVSKSLSFPFLYDEQHSYEIENDGGKVQQLEINKEYNLGGVCVSSWF